MFVDHILAGSELYVRLRELETKGIVEELVFEPEPSCWRYWTGAGGEQLVLKPDAFVWYGQGDYEHSFFIEVDRASQSGSVINHKAEVYLSYLRSGQEQTRHGVFPRVLFVTIDDRRRSQIADALARLDPKEWRLFEVQTMTEAFAGINRGPPD